MHKPKPDKKETWYKELITLMQKSAHTKQSLTEFLTDLLTPAEQLYLAQRWQVVKLLNEGMSQREIVDELGVGINTVTRGSHILANKQGAFYKILNK